MKWQRARIIAGPCRGGELWLQAGPPLTMSIVGSHGGGLVPYEPHDRRFVLRFLTHLESARTGREIAISPELVELLARGPEDFLDEDPPEELLEAWRESKGLGPRQ